ncbi:4-(cytidine 5'-diphospho)-2-C-methyl-D-erythritol kinase [Paenalcaligenes hominis]|uniref:4-(cytidine 5'-diphospho)-2-C-methyl-D-erythritol kinase n=1 Tax=Paenalcaligenes hominis TaxID=643674 RepID=UPI0035256192
MATKALTAVPAPAKLNLFLHVVGRRADGYHLLQSVFTFIDLCDYLDFELRTDGVIERVGESLAGLEPEQDLIIKAARLLQATTGVTYGARIRCQKNIPAGAGLGGGSSDAATTLIALNKLWQTRLTRSQLMQLGLQLGADVPVFIFGQNAFAEGVGEQLQAITLPNLHYIVLTPQAFVPTPVIFSDKGLTRNQKPIIITDFTGSLIQPDAKYHDSVSLFGINNLEPIACKFEPEINTLFQVLHKAKLHARMTGSGSSFFVPFLDKETACRQSSYLCDIVLHEQLSVQQQPQMWVVSGVNTHPLYNWLNEFGD